MKNQNSIDSIHKYRLNVPLNMGSIEDSKKISTLDLSHFFKPYLLLLVFSLIALMNQQSFSQTQPSQNGTVIKDWQKMSVSSQEIEVSYSVVNCNNVNQLSLKLLNKKTTGRTAKFRVDIINTGNGERFTKEVNVPLLASQEIKGDCSVSALKIELPTNYNPANIYVAVTF